MANARAWRPHSNTKSVHAASLADEVFIITRNRKTPLERNT